MIMKLSEWMVNGSGIVLSYSVKWQHLAVGYGARFAVAGITCFSLQSVVVLSLYIACLLVHVTHQFVILDW